MRLVCSGVHGRFLEYVTARLTTGRMLMPQNQIVYHIQNNLLVVLRVGTIRCKRLRMLVAIQVCQFSSATM